jgi:hypothetical protein
MAFKNQNPKLLLGIPGLDSLPCKTRQLINSYNMMKKNGRKMPTYSMKILAGRCPPLMRIPSEHFVKSDIIIIIIVST